MQFDNLIMEKLSALAIFQGLEPAQIDLIAGCGEIVNFQNGEKIIEETSVGKDLYAILDGRVSVEIMTTTQSSLKERNIRITILRPGDVFGDMAFLGSTRRCATVTAIDNFSAVIFDHDRLYDLFETNNLIGYIVVKNLAMIMSDRLMELNFIVRRGY